MVNYRVGDDDGCDDTIPGSITFTTAAGVLYYYYKYYRLKKKIIFHSSVNKLYSFTIINIIIRDRYPLCTTFRNTTSERLQNLTNNFWKMVYNISRAENEDIDVYKRTSIRRTYREISKAPLRESGFQIKFRFSNCAKSVI